MKIHVVSFQVPFPPDYGGAIDVYYKLKYLHERGDYIVLHTYEYDHPRHERELLEVVDEVHYYKRKTGLMSQFGLLPYIVKSRSDEQLVQNLLADDSPILFEGLHCCYPLSDNRLKDRKKLVRMHNIEHDYYQLLAEQSGWSWRTIYYRVEAWKLRRYESVLRHASEILAITDADRDELQTRYPEVPTRTLPCFFDMEFVEDTGGTEPYLLYQGNLGVEENIRVARYIIDELYVKRDTPYPLVVAGKNPSAKLQTEIGNFPKITLYANPSDEKMSELLAKARINLLLTFQPTGIKLKLMNALCKSRGHCVVNDEMLHGNNLRTLCHVVSNASELADSIGELMVSTPDAESLRQRKQFIEQNYIK